MTEITGRLISDMHPNGTVRLVFLQCSGGGCERPLIAQNLDMAEKEFINTLGLTPDEAAVLRAQLEQDKMADAVIRTDAEVAATFRNYSLRRD
jgi:hypothetical protein